MAEPSLTPLEVERAEFGCNIEQIRGHGIRIIHLLSADLENTKCVFFFHGGGGRACQFKHQIRALKDKADIVAVDYLGHGDSPSPNEPNLYTADEHLATTYEIFTKYKKSDNYIVCHCYGSIHTLRLLKQLKDQGTHLCVKGLIIIALGTNCPVQGFATKLVHIPAFIQEWLRPLARSSSNAKLFSTETDQSLIDFENSCTDNNRMYMMRVIGADCSNQEQWTQWLHDGKEAISNDIPVSLIIGEEDGLFSVDSCHQLVDMFSIDEKMFHTIPSAAHLSMLEKPEIINEIITNYINHW